MSKRIVFCDIFSVSVSVAVLQVWPLADADNLSYAHSNGMFSVAMTLRLYVYKYLYGLVRECGLEQSFKPFSNILYVY